MDSSILIGHFEIGQPFLTDMDYVCMHVCTCIPTYVQNPTESLVLNLMIGRTNWHSAIVTNNDSFLVSHTQFVWKMAEGRLLFLALYVHIHIRKCACIYTYIQYVLVLLT